MARVRLRGRATGTTRKGELTDMQRAVLNTGFEMGSGADFATPEEYRAAWWAHRDELLVAFPYSFFRPEAYWWVEIDMVPTGCAASEYKTEEQALLRLELPLTAQERAILAGREKATGVARACNGEIEG